MLSVEVAEWLEHLGPHPGDRWFDPRRRSFAKKVEYFMIIVVYLPPGPGGKGGNVTKEFKLVLESAYYLVSMSLVFGNDTCSKKAEESSLFLFIKPVKIHENETCNRATSISTEKIGQHE